MMSSDFTPQYHFKNSSGQWQMRPFDPRLATQAANEAQRLAAAGETLAPIVDEGTAFNSPLMRG